VDSALGSKLVELGFSTGLGGLPAGTKQLFIFQTMERGVERALLDLEYVPRDLPDSLRDGVAVNRSKCDDPRDEEVEGSLRKIEAIVSLFHTYDFYIYISQV
jgi:hypothetical protein